MKILNEICDKLGDRWIIDSNPKNELIAGYYRLKSDSDKNKNFSMYCCVMGERLYIKGCVKDELNGLTYSTKLQRGADKIAKSIRINVISQKSYLFSIINKRR